MKSKLSIIQDAFVRRMTTSTTKTNYSKKSFISNFSRESDKRLFNREKIKMSHWSVVPLQQCTLRHITHKENWCYKIKVNYVILVYSL